MYIKDLKKNNTNITVSESIPPCDLPALQQSGQCGGEVPSASQHYSSLVFYYFPKEATRYITLVLEFTAVLLTIVEGRERLQYLTFCSLKRCTLLLCRLHARLG